VSPTLTRIPVVLPRLVQIATDALDDVQVLDGPRAGELDARILIVGLPGDGGRAPYSTSTTQQDGLGRPRLREDWTVHCLLSLATGTADVAGMRTACGSALGHLDDALRDAHVVPGVWDRARLGGDMDWLAMPTTTGALCSVVFDITGSGLL
jgi:hypothetical protein